MTTLQPRPPYSSEELARLYPRNLELQQVQVLLRHGERTPVGARFQNAGLHAHWPYCGAANKIRSVVLDSNGTFDTLTWKRKLETLGSNDTPVPSLGPNGESDAICKPGELTDKGRETTLALGQRIRSLYVDRLGFLPAVMDDTTQSAITLRATPIQRALESVQQAFVGLYPAGQRRAGLAPPSITQRLMQDETLVPNEGGCRRFAELSAAFAERTAQLWNDSPEMQYLDAKLGRWMPRATPAVRVDGHPRLSGIMDSTNAALAHGPATRLPAAFFDPRVRAHTDRICTEEWFVGYQESAEYRRLGIGALVGEMAQQMVARVGSAGRGGSKEASSSSSSSPPPPFKLSLAGCHDTTIAAVLTSLGALRVDRDPWPRFTSSIAFELFRAREPASPSVPALGDASNSSSSNGAVWPSKERSWWYSLFSPSASSSAAAPQPNLDGYFVRLRYNDEPVVLPACQPAGAHADGDESMCTLAAFKAAADAITPADWRAECRANLGAPAFPPNIEPPPGVVA